MIGAIGAQCPGADLAEIDPEALLDALDRYQLLVLRDLRLEPESLTEFAASLGPLDTYPFAAAIEGCPHVVRLLKEPEDASNFGGAWHTDTSYQSQPPAITLLYAVEIPGSGGDTLFADMYGVFERLSEGFKSELRKLTGHNTASLVHDAQGDYAAVTGQSVSLKASERVTEADHPLVIRHHRTGREALFFSLIHTAGLVGFSGPESLVLLQQLHELTTEASNTTRLRWSPGTLAIWDNRAVQHYPLNDYPGERREMHRVILKGDRPLR